MKYIVTWIIVQTVFLPSSDLVSHQKIDKINQEIEFTNRYDAVNFFNERLIEYNSQFDDSAKTLIHCPKCYKYIIDVKLDSSLNKK